MSDPIKQGIVVGAALAGALLVGRGAEPPAPPAPARPEQTTQMLSGDASWYSTGPGRGDAAAGPGLRSFLGADWRGTKVRVCAEGQCIRVTLSDWCQCLWKQPSERIIDLSDEDFAKLAALSRGLITVEVTP